MSLAEIKLLLLWSSAINYGLLLLWCAILVFAHDAFYRLNARLFRITPQIFDTVNYGGIAAYKMAILFFNFVPWVVLVLTSSST